MNTSSVNLKLNDTIVSEFQFQIHKRVDIGQNEYDFWFDLRMTRTQSFGLRSTELEAEPDHASKSQTRDTSEMEEAAIQSSK